MNKNFLKLTNSAYKLLEFFPESDPLKNKAKERVLAIMSAFGGSPVGGENLMEAAPQSGASLARLEEARRDIDILLGYFEVGRAQGWLSGINCLIVSNEYEKIKKEIELMPEIIRKPPETEALKFSENFKEHFDKPAAISDSQDLGKVTERQEAILNFLRKNEKAQVMDFKKVLPNVTKRTIRRDLNELLKEGKIIRLGEFNQVFYRLA